jgi:hypothetical protein
VRLSAAASRRSTPIFARRFFAIETIEEEVLNAKLAARDVRDQAAARRCAQSDT